MQKNISHPEQFNEPRQGACPDEIMCCNCEEVFSPEIIETHECPDCGADNTPA